MKQNGQMLTCDRCGTSIFRLCAGEGEADGGFTRWNTFEDAEGWSLGEGIRTASGLEWLTLCPACLAEFHQSNEDFLKKKEVPES